MSGALTEPQGGDITFLRTAAVNEGSGIPDLHENLIGRALLGLRQK